MKTAYGLVALLSLGACGGESDLGVSGVAEETLVGEMTTSEIRQLCEFAAATMGGEGRVVDCGEVTRVVDSVNTCLGSWDNSGICANTEVKQVEACLQTRGENICRDAENIAECKPLFDCNGNGPDDSEAPPSTTPPNDEWDCYASSSGHSYTGCNFEWRCPGDADRSLTCNLGSDNKTYYCTCNNIKLGVEEGQFSATDICDLESHNVAYRVNQACGYSLPEL